MYMKHAYRRSLIAGLIGLLLMLVGTALAFAGGQGEAESGSQSLTVWVWPQMNLDDQIMEWAEINDVEVEIVSAQRDDFMDNLTASFSAGSGAPDVAAVGGPFIERFKATPQHWVNFREFEADELADQYVQWRWNQMFDQSGEFMIGLPTDIGPIAMAYRLDLFEDAGLPVSREEVASEIDSWDAFIDAGIQLRETTGASMIANLGTMFESMIGQNQRAFFDDSGNLDLEGSELLNNAWETAVRAHNAGISENAETFSADWGAGLQGGDFAVQLLPAWMMGAIRNNAPDASGMWDITEIPEGGTNWGGSMIGIPAQSDNPELAYELITWLLSPEQQLETFLNGGQFPSTPPVYDEEAFTSSTDPFFNDAPFGQIFARAAQDIEGSALSADWEMVRSEFIDALDRVEDGMDPNESWDIVSADIRRQMNR